MFHSFEEEAAEEGFREAALAGDSKAVAHFNKLLEERPWNDPEYYRQDKKPEVWIECASCKKKIKDEWSYHGDCAVCANEKNLEQSRTDPGLVAESRVAQAHVVGFKNGIQKAVDLLDMKSRLSNNFEVKSAFEKAAVEIGSFIKEKEKLTLWEDPIDEFGNKLIDEETETGLG